MNAKYLSVSLVAATLAAASWAFASAAPDTGAPTSVGPITHLAVGTVRSVEASRSLYGSSAGNWRREATSTMAAATDTSRED